MYLCFFNNEYNQSYPPFISSTILLLVFGDFLVGHFFPCCSQRMQMIRLRHLPSKPLGRLPIFLLVLHVSEVYNSTERTLNLYSFIVEILFSMLLSADMKLLRYSSSFMCSSTFPRTVFFLVLRVFSFLSLVLFRLS